MARSPLDQSPPDRVQPPYYNQFNGKYIVACPSGENLEFTSREAAWKAYYRMREEQ